MLNLKKLAFGAVGLLLLSGSMALAQRPNQNDPRLNGQPSTPKTTTSTTPTTTPAVVNIDQVGTMLKGLGYQFKTVNRQPGNFVVHELDITSKGKFVPMDVSLSQDGTKLWLTVVLSQLSPGETIPADVMRKMLEITSTIGPNHFMITKNGLIFLQCAMDNRGITPEELRRQIDLLAMDCADTENIWNRNSWGTQVGIGK